MRWHRRPRRTPRTRRRDRSRAPAPAPGPGKDRCCNGRATSSRTRRGSSPTRATSPRELGAPRDAEHEARERFRVELGRREQAVQKLFAESSELVEALDPLHLELRTRALLGVVTADLRLQKPQSFFASLHE